MWKQESGLKISVVIYTGQENVCEVGRTLANDDGTRIKNLTCTGRNNVEKGNETSLYSDDSSVYILSENGSEKTFDFTTRAQLKCIDSKWYFGQNPGLLSHSISHIFIVSWYECSWRIRFQLDQRARFQSRCLSTSFQRRIKRLKTSNPSASIVRFRSGCLI